MPRIIEVTGAGQAAKDWVQAVNDIDGVISIVIGTEAERDRVVIRATNAATRKVLQLLHETQAIGKGDILVSSQPNVVLAPDHQPELDDDSDETTWEEMDDFLRREANASNNYAQLMLIAGALAGFGLWTGLVYIVIAAMVIAPGFEPILRISFCLLIGPLSGVLRAVVATAIGYGLLAMGGAIAYALQSWLAGPLPDLQDLELVRHWSRLGQTDAIVALFAGAGGAAVISAQKGVLSAGVMIALALIPSMALAGMALAAWDLPLAAAALGRWMADAAAVLVAGAFVLWLKKRLLQNRRTMG